MQLTPFCLFALILGYSVVLSAPVQKASSDSEDVKHQKAHAIANRLLKELAGEQQVIGHPQEESPKKEDNQVDGATAEKKPAVEQVQSHVQNEQNDIVDDNIAADEEEIDETPSLDDLLEIYGDRYAQLIDDEDSSLETNGDIDDELLLPVSTQELLRYLAAQEESDESDIPVIHTPVIDDSLMTAEDHQHRRRRRSIY